MVKIKASSQFCGCCTLLLGVEFVCALHLCITISTIAFISSVHPIEVVGVTFEPWEQIANGAWCLLGTPIIVGAGIGALYRIESQLRVYFYYLCGCFLLDLLYAGNFLFSGTVCASIIAPEVQRLGASFVCGMTDTFFMFWVLVFFVVLGYFIFTVWSAAEEVSRTHHHHEPLLHKEAVQRLLAPQLPGQQTQYGTA
mmetsp:Transcript_3500/g.8273  ORF Transcript_3500/g.8273 Transcript_3500/m.8273 type:complete len:197 (-) Transcript_3500:136-726(-)